MYRFLGLTVMLSLSCLVSSQKIKGPYPGLVRKECLVWYSEGLEVVVWSPGEETSKPVVEFDRDPTASDVTCGTNFVNGVKSTTIKFTFQSKPTGYSASLEWQFDTLRDGDWYLNDKKSQIVLSGQDIQGTYKFQDSELEAANQFSFSCSSFSVRSDNSSRNAENLMELRIKRFQVQPFTLDKELKMIFADSFDCSTWFTIPVWVGFLVTLLFTAILSFGVYGVMSIKTPDRFENPKGKTITITATD